jgi:ketosteroid isomerase-like protein
VKTWQDEIRAREEQARAAFLKVDLAALDELWTEDFMVNSPLEQLVPRRRLVELLRAGRIRHSAYELHIEHMSRHGDFAIVMGRDRVVDPPKTTPTHRRFTNFWRLEGGVWRMVARHAQAVAPPPG